MIKWIGSNPNINSEFDNAIILSDRDTAKLRVRFRVAIEMEAPKSARDFF